MKITYDLSGDSAYISFISSGHGDVVKTYPCDPIEVNGEINLDFDSTGNLVGIEILDAARLLPKELLKIAEIIG